MPSISARGLRLALFSDTYAPQVNGVSRTLERLALEVRARGGDVRIFTASDPAALPDPHVVRLPSVAFWAYRELRLAPPISPRALREVRLWRPTLIHAATPFGIGLSGRAAARQLGIPFVSSYHTHFSAYVRFYNLGALETLSWGFLRWFHNGGLRTYVPSSAIRAELGERGFADMRVWPRGVDTTRFAPSFRTREMRARVGAAGDETVVAAYVGRLAPEKGIDVAIEAMRMAMQRMRGRLVFALAGDGPYEDHCRAVAPRGSHFAGRLSGDELSRFYASADIFLFPSETDTFGNVLLEAMASGLPVVGADVATTPELVGTDRGALFPPGDAKVMADRIVQLAENALRRRAMSAAAAAFAEECSWTRVWDGLIADYLDVVDGRAAVGSAG
ncbi:MAG TPA: glycosyltransferase family 1 protein [Gemmatimonadaceae bacterium]